MRSRDDQNHDHTVPLADAPHSAGSAQAPADGAPEAPVLPGIAAPLLKWYDAHRRVLPWREDPAPYHVWISEIMLQQTRVEAVIPYYLRFLAELPDVAALAACPEDRLLKLWEGLGYYSRARNLQKAARQMMDLHGGALPEDPETLVKLAGIGPYTAAAVASIAYGKKIPAVDGNLLRVFARLTGYAENIGAPAAKKLAAAAYLRVFPDSRPGDMNQALMDLGAVVCLPNGAPHCGDCPLEACCTARRDGTQEQLPVIEKKAPRRIEKRTVLLVRTADGSILIKKRPAKGLLAGLWEFPNPEGHLTEAQVLAWCAARGLSSRDVRPLPPARHVFTHLEWDMTGYEIWLDAPGRTGLLREASAAESSAPDQNEADGGFVPVRQVLSDFALPSAFAAYSVFL